MTLNHKPIAGNWYETTESLSFKVINIDHDGEAIEIQFLDGAHEIVGFDVWNTWEVEPIIPPSDWEGLCDEALGGVPDNNAMDDAPVNDESWGEHDDLMDEDAEIKEY